MAQLPVICFLGLLGIVSLGSSAGIDLLVEFEGPYLQQTVSQEVIRFDAKDKNLAAIIVDWCIRKSAIPKCRSVFEAAVREQYRHHPSLQAYDVLLSYKQFSTLFTQHFVPQYLRGRPVAAEEVLHSPRNYFPFTADIMSEAKLVLCVSHYHEDISWLLHVDAPFIVVSKTITSSNPVLHIDVNAGNEVSSYLGYIVRYYDELPSFTLFLHGHDDHWHQIYNMHYIVHHLDFSQTYRNINNYWVNDRNSSSNTYMRRLQLLWNELFQDELGPMPSQFQDKCCAQMLVHRDAIRTRSIDFYRRLDRFVTHQGNDADEGDGYHTSMSYVMEFVWHYLFGEPAVKEYTDDFFIRHGEFMRIYL